MKTLYVVRNNPVAGREDEFNDWYNQVHLQEVLKIDGFLSAPRFCLNEVQLVPGQPFGYMALYEIDSQDVAGTLANLRAATWMNVSDAIDLENMDISVFTTVGDQLLSI